MKIFQKVLELSTSDKATDCVDITKHIQKVINESALSAGVVMVHTMHTTTGLTKGGRKPSSGFLVQENEPLLLADIGETLNEGAEKFLQALPHIAAGRARFLDLVPRGLLDNLLEVIITALRPSGYFKHDDFSVRIENMHPNERKNTVAHLKAAMLRETLLWSFSDGKLNLGTWQSLLLWDFDAKGRGRRKINVVVIGK